MNSSYDIKVLIERAEELRAADSNGKSDPYVSYYRADVPSAVFKTKVIEKTLEPVWNDIKSWSFNLNETNWTLVFDVYDKDMIGKDFSIKVGHAEIDLKKELNNGEKKVEKKIVLELGPGPKTSEKSAKKITGKLHVAVHYPQILMLDDAAREKIETQTATNREIRGALDELLPQFHALSGGADTISDKAKIAQLAGDRKIFMFIIGLTVNDDTTGYTDEVIRELVNETDLVDYFSRIMLIITNSTAEGGVSLTDYLKGYSVVTAGMYSQAKDSLMFKLLDADGNGTLSFDDLMAFQAITPYGIKVKMANEFLKDPKIQALKEKAGHYGFRSVINDIFRKYQYPAVGKMLVIHQTTGMQTVVQNLKDIQYTQEEFIAWFKNEEKRKQLRVHIARDLTKMMKEHNKEAQVELNKAMFKHGIN